MPELYIVRHAKSSWADANLADSERPLNNRGLYDAPFMAKELATRIARGNRTYELSLFSSPAVRALTTAHYFHEAFLAQQLPTSAPVQQAELYEGSLAEHLELLHSMAKLTAPPQRLLLFGHNPEFTQLCNLLSLEPIDNLPTCGIYALTFNCSWRELQKGSCRVEFYIYPKLYREP